MRGVEPSFEILATGRDGRLTAGRAAHVGLARMRPARGATSVLRRKLAMRRTLVKKTVRRINAGSRPTGDDGR